MISNVLNSGSALERFFLNTCVLLLCLCFTLIVFVSADHFYLFSFDTFSSQVPIDADRARGPGEQDFVTLSDITKSQKCLSTLHILNIIPSD